MVNTITIVDSGVDKYTIERDSSILGRMYDNEADSMQIIIPEAEIGRACIMIITACGKVVDHIVVPESGTIPIRNNISMHSVVRIGFSFQDATGYIKNSDVMGFSFLEAQKPDDFVPVEPEQIQQYDLLLALGFTDSYLDGNTLIFKNLNGDIVKQFDLSPFVQEQADLGETDPTSESFVKGKVTSNLVNDGDGTSPYATEDYVQENSGSIASISVNGATLPIDENKNVDIPVPTETSQLTNTGADGTSPYATEQYVETNGGKINTISVNGTPQAIDENKNVELTITKDTVGLSNVDNTSDMDKPVSTATQTALDTLSQNLSTDISENATAIANLDTRVTTNANAISDFNVQLEFVQGDVATLENDLGTLSNTVSEISTDLDTAEENITNLQNDLSNTNATVAALQSDLNTANTNISDLQTGLNDTNTTISSLQENLESANTNITNLQNDLGDAKTDIATLQDGLQSANTDIGSLETGLSQTNAKVLTLESGLQSANSNISNLQTGLQATDANVAQLQTDMQTANTNITNLQAGLSSANSNISTLQTGLSTANSKISSLETGLGDTNGRVSTLETGLESANANIDLKLDKANANVDMAQDITKTGSGDNIYLTVAYKNLATGAETTSNKQIDLASETTAGLMSTADYAQLRENTSRIEQLEGQTTRLIYTDSTNPTAEEINAFVTGLGYTAPFTGIAVVVDQTFHIWHYYSNTSQWQDDGTDTVNLFTNTTAGIIKGSDVDGKVYAESDGTGSVKGWGTLTGKVSSAESNITSLQGVTTQQRADINTNTANIATNTQAIANINTSLTGKQDTLTAGANITIENNTISATDTTYTAGANIVISDNNIISATDTIYDNATQTKDGLMSSADKTKLDGIASGATKVEGSTINGSIQVNGEEVTVYTLPTDVVQDANYVHTDNNFTNDEKSKLAGIESGAQANTVDSVNGETGAVVLDAIDVGALPDTTKYAQSLSSDGQTITLADQDGTVLSTITTQDTTYADATQTTSGLMSASDKTKLDGIEDGAQVNTVDSVNGEIGTVWLDAVDVNALPAATQFGQTLSVNGTTVNLLDQNGATLSTITTQDTTYTDATVDTAGLMSASDKEKLDSVQAGAEINVQADWAETDTTSDAYIKNKPTIPTKVSELENDTGFITSASLPKLIISSKVNMEV